MPNLFGKKYTYRQLIQYIGDISQLGGLKHYELASGVGKGVGAVDFNTGTGFEFTVLLDRGMDISEARYNGQSLCWRSSTGDVAPAFFDPNGIGWLRSFFGGLVLTCGLDNVGPPCEDGQKQFGLHGRYTSIPASNIEIEQKWDCDEFVMSVEGQMRETSVFGMNLLLTREISAKLGESRLVIHDTIENQGYEKTPVMILYHCNFGFPLVDEHAELISPSIKVIPRDAAAEQGKDDYDKFQQPTQGYQEKVYFHQLQPDKAGYVKVALINKKRDLGVYLKYQKKQLPRFTQWKMLGQGIYVCGLEPGNCGVLGRAKEREAGTLEFLNPGEKKEIQLEIGVLTNQQDVRKFTNNIKKIK
ncbi:MAG: aldose 1-epimerase family protein [bacterium]|nr:aldose 1-epimerase family protein [bacterium]